MKIREIKASELNELLELYTHNFLFGASSESYIRAAERIVQNFSQLATEAWQEQIRRYCQNR